MAELGEENSLRNRLRIVLYLLLVAGIVTLLSSGVYFYYEGVGLTILDIAVSAVLSAALVILYFRQTTILESQKDLLTQELNREARQQHTETLRERVRTWHGSPDKEISNSPFDESELNIPTIAGASFRSAPTGIYTAVRPEEEPFQVLPDQLKGDRYVEDLLENHAPDLKSQKQHIEDLYNQFAELKEEFREEFEGKTVEHENYRIEPDDYLSLWIFQLLVLKERGLLDDFEDLKDRAISEFERGETSLHPDEPRIWVQVEKGGGSYYSVYSALYESSDRDAINDNRSEIKKHVKEVVRAVLEDIDDDYPLDLADEAADILDEASKAVTELEQILIEYEGRPIFPGDCTYLEEAKI